MGRFSFGSKIGFNEQSYLRETFADLPRAPKLCVGAAQSAAASYFYSFIS